MKDTTLQDTNQNVISLAGHRQKQNDSHEEQSIIRHLRLLSFSELINETSHLIKKVNSHTSNLPTELEIKSKLTVKELGSRLRSQKSLPSEEINKLDLQ